MTMELFSGTHGSLNKRNKKHIWLFEENIIYKYDNVVSNYVKIYLSNQITMILATYHLDMASGQKSIAGKR